MAFDKLLGFLTPGWQGRVQEGAYTSPAGLRIPFDFEDVSRETKKRTASFEFNGVDDAFIQDNGHGARVYKLRCFFVGPNHDLLATSFEVGLLEVGIGKLEHPFYGTFDVTPVGVVSRQNAMVAAANQSIVDVTFSTTLPGAYPRGEAINKNELVAAVDGFNVAAALDFQDTVNFTGVRGTIAKSGIRRALGAVKEALQSVADTTASVKREFDTIAREINTSLDILIGQPFALAQQISNLLLAPSRAVTGIESRIAGYRRAVERLIFINRDAVNENDFRINDLFVLGALNGLNNSLGEAEYQSKQQALEASETFQDAAALGIDWREAELSANGFFDTGRGYQSQQDGQASAEGYLVGLAFTLLPERHLVIDRDRTPADLCAQLYGRLDDETLQFFLDSNRFGGDGLLVIAGGTTVVFYA